MSKPVEVTEETFEQEVINSKVPTVVDFWAVWCGPCKVIAPYMEEFASEYEGRVKVAKVNVDDSPNIAVKYGIRSIPTLMIFRDGKEVHRVSGALDETSLSQLVTQFT